MSGLSFRELAEANAARLVRWHPPSTIPWTVADWSNAMQGEAGEAGNLVKKLRRYDTNVLVDPTGSAQRTLAKGIGLELADVVIYADLLAHHLVTRFGRDVCYPLEELVVTKFNAVSHREGFPERLQARWLTQPVLRERDETGKVISEHS